VKTEGKRMYSYMCALKENREEKTR